MVQPCLFAILNMKIIRQAAIATITNRQLPKQGKPFCIHLPQCFLFLSRHIFQIKIQALSFNFLMRKPIKSFHIIRHVQKIILEQIDNIHALICASRKRLDCIFQKFRTR